MDLCNVRLRVLSPFLRVGGRGEALEAAAFSKALASGSTTLAGTAAWAAGVAAGAGGSEALVDSRL